MAIPILLQVAHAAQALPVFAVAAVRGRPLPVPYLRLAAFCTLLVLSDVMDLAITYSGRTNLWTAYFMMPVEVGLTVWIVSSWQQPDWQRRYILAIAVAGAAVAAALLLTDPSHTFDVWIAPLLALLGLAAALHTLVIRSLQSRQSLLESDWFWICAGFAVFWTIQVSAPAFMAAFMETHREWVITVLLVRAALMIIAFLLMAWGIVCRQIASR